MSERYPRVLILSAQSFNQVTGTGITFSNLFRGWPKESIATIHNDPVECSTDICDRYWRLGSAQVRRWLLPTPDAQAGGTVVASASGQSPMRRLVGRAKAALIGNAWPDVGVLTPDLRAWIADFAPDVLYTPLGSMGMMSLIHQVQQAFDLPLVVHFMDDWPEVLYRGGLLSPLLHGRMETLLRRLVRNASSRLAIGPSMASTYSRRYGGEFLAFQNTVDVTLRAAQAKADAGVVSNPSRVLYVGSLFANAQVQSVVECARAVGILADSGRPIRMDIHSPSFLAEPFRHQLCHHPSVHLHDTIRQDDEFFATIAAADILLLPVNFDSESIRLIRYSMPTKLPAYLISGTPILAYGPNRVAQMEYLHDTGSAVLVNDRDERRLVETIARLLDDAALRRQVVGAALATARANHDMASVRTAFQKNLVAQARRRV